MEYSKNAVANLKTLMNTKDDFTIAENGNFQPLQISVICWIMKP
jgi:cobalt-zinc-cadmium resistance protein CzcA